MEKLFYLFYESLQDLTLGCTTTSESIVTAEAFETIAGGPSSSSGRTISSLDQHQAICLQKVIDLAG